MINKRMLKLIGKISPQAREYVCEMSQNNNVEVLYSIFTEENEGVFLKTEEDDSCIFFASFVDEDDTEELLEVVYFTLTNYISNTVTKEICFNVYGLNSKIICLVRELGFKVDMEGYHLEYTGKALPEINKDRLSVKGFENEMIDQFVELFDSAYYHINVDNGWDTESSAKHKVQFNAKLGNLDKSNQVQSFWKDDELVGAYIFKRNYITDIVVMPRFQNKGYGSLILAHCIVNMRINKSVQKIRLRVAKSNIGAKKFYERNGFIEIANFAEHTL